MTQEAYHYTGCGLDNVYLKNGYEIVSTPEGTRLHIEDIEGLHKLIGQRIVSDVRDLSGKEFRFIRVQMSMSQATLAKLLQVSEQAINRWENEKTDHIPMTAQALLRFLYQDTMGLNTASTFRNSLQRIADIEDELDDINFEISLEGESWKIAA